MPGMMKDKDAKKMMMHGGMPHGGAKDKTKMMYGGMGKKTKMMYGGMGKKKVEMAHGGMANGKKHMYAAGGSVMDNLTPAQRNMMKKMAEANK